MEELRIYLIAKYKEDPTITLEKLFQAANVEKRFAEVKRKKEVPSFQKRWKTSLVSSIIREDNPNAFPRGGGTPLPFSHSDGEYYDISSFLI